MPNLLHSAKILFLSSTQRAGLDEGDVSEVQTEWDLKLRRALDNAEEIERGLSQVNPAWKAVVRSVKSTCTSAKVVVSEGTGRKKKQVEDTFNGADEAYLEFVHASEEAAAQLEGVCGRELFTGGTTLAHVLSEDVNSARLEFDHYYNKCERLSERARERRVNETALERLVRNRVKLERSRDSGAGALGVGGGVVVPDERGGGAARGDRHHRGQGVGQCGDGQSARYPRHVGQRARRGQESARAAAGRLGGACRPGHRSPLLHLARGEDHVVGATDAAAVRESDQGAERKVRAGHSVATGRERNVRDTKVLRIGRTGVIFLVKGAGASPLAEDDITGVAAAATRQRKVVMAWTPRIGEKGKEFAVIRCSHDTASMNRCPGSSTRPLRCARLP
eukprot:ctg_1456.g506